MPGEPKVGDIVHFIPDEPWMVSPELSEMPAAPSWPCLAALVVRTEWTSNHPDLPGPVELAIYVPSGGWRPGTTAVTVTARICGHNEQHTAGTWHWNHD